MISSMFCKTNWSARVMSHIWMNGCHTYEWVDVTHMNESMCHYICVTRMKELTWQPWMPMFCKTSWSARVMSHIQISWCHTYGWMDVTHMNEWMSHLWMSPCVTIYMSHLWKSRHDTHECRCSARPVDLLQSCHAYEWGDCRTYEWINVTNMNELTSHIWISPCVIGRSIYICHTYEWVDMTPMNVDVLQELLICSSHVTHSNKLMSHIWTSWCHTNA